MQLLKGCSRLSARSAEKLEEPVAQRYEDSERLRPLVSIHLLLMDSPCDVCPCVTNDADVSGAVYAIRPCA